MKKDATSTDAFEFWYRQKFGHDCTGADGRVRMGWEAGVRWLTMHSGMGGGDIHTMTADQLRARLILAVEAETRAHDRITELEDKIAAMEAASVRPDA